jgi:hypothetical protein
VKKISSNIFARHVRLCDPVLALHDELAKALESYKSKRSQVFTKFNKDSCNFFRRISSIRGKRLAIGFASDDLNGQNKDGT